MPAVKKALSDKFAVIKTGGKQYPVSVGDVIRVEKIADDLVAGATVTFDEVLLVADGDKVQIGTPTLKSTVKAEFIENSKEAKIRVTRFMPKSNRHRTIGHRQPFTKVKITEIK